MGTQIVGHGETGSRAWGHREWGMGTQEIGHGELFKIFDNTEQTYMQIVIDLAC